MRPKLFFNKIKQALSSKPRFATSDVKIGRNVHFGQHVNFNCKRVRIGDGTIFQDNIRIDSDVFEIGDYGTIYSYCFFPGPGELRIGHNFWLGMGSIIECQGGTTIRNNVGIGAQSQLWTHIQFGDVLYGCRFHGAKPLIIEDDAWLVGHCLVSPVKIGKRSIAMLGSVITKDMKSDRAYAGVPAIDITEKVGPQFKISSVEERKKQLQQLINDFARNNNIKNINNYIEINSMSGQIDTNKIVFNIADRTYLKHNTDLENKIMRFLLPAAKFIPE